MGAGFGNDGLDSLSETQLRARLRQIYAYMALLEETVVLYAQDGRPAHAKDFTDPEEYFELIGLDPKTVETPKFDVLLIACYRTLARSWHPDKGGDTVKFQKLQAAYDTLSDPVKRKQYLKTGGWKV